MSQYAKGDVVRVRPDAAPFTGCVGVVTAAHPDTDDWLSVEFDQGAEVVLLAYRASELDLVRAVISAPRVVTVVV